MYLIGTAGPKIKDKIFLRRVIENGMNALRVNFSHGTCEEFFEFAQNSRNINNEIKILVDMPGTKIRISDKFEYIYKVYDGEEIFFCGEDNYYFLKKNLKDKKVIPLNIEEKYLHENNYNYIFIKDNTMQFEIIEKMQTGIKVKTIWGGVIRRGKGCNIKGFNRDNIELSIKDRNALLWGIKNNADMFCQSFVESRTDIIKVKEFITNNSSNFVPKIWAKIETEKGVKNVNNIIKECDGIIIGRGDMLSETSIEEAPIYEENIINVVKEHKNKDIIIATHILDSMKDGKRPTISESECVYNFIKKGVNGFILAGETSIGRTPVKSVRFLKGLIDKYEDNFKKSI